MVTPFRPHHLAVWVGICFLAASTPIQAIEPLDSTFTYQGRITHEGVPLSGTADIRMTLHNAAEGGAQVGSTYTASNVPFVDGLFTAEPGFGVTVLDGNKRWLQISIRVPHDPSNAGAFTTLSPRQPVNPSPYALQTRGIFVNPVGNRAGIGTTDPQGGLHVVQDTQNSDIVIESASDHASGARARLRLIHPENTWHIEADGVQDRLKIRDQTAAQDRLVIDPLGNIGIGTGNPTQRLSVSGIIQSMTGGFRFPDGTTQTTAAEGSKWSTSSNNISSTNSGNVGIGTASPAHKLSVAGIISSTTGGFRFPDGTTQATSVVQRWNATGDNISSANSGNVGIGTNSPSTKLTVESGNSPGIRVISNVAIGAAVNGINTEPVNSFGVRGEGFLGIYGVASAAEGSLAGLFVGDVYSSGGIFGASKSFVIDHPLDPANKILRHTSVESPDMMTVYAGNVVTGEDGRATVLLPDYFEALNRDFRYQLTIIDEGDHDHFVQARVSRRIAHNQFEIRTSAPAVEVSWQVTGTRQDAWAERNRATVEEEKPSDKRGRYLNPEAYDQPTTKGYFELEPARDL